jgi:hypothetical protein
MNWEIGNKKMTVLGSGNGNKWLIVLTAVVLLFATRVNAQVTTEVDTTTIRIGEQISYKIKVKTDSSALVVFPEGQTFLPLEAVEASEIDTLRFEAQYTLSRRYKLTQFDSGQYVIPRQRILIGDTPVFTDSLRVVVNTIPVDTTKQKLYDIKPIIEVKSTYGNWWKWLLLIFGLVAVVAFLLYWFIWREKPLTEEEQLALLPPYDRALRALENLEVKDQLTRSDIKAYYSELTFIIRNYLDEKVYERSLESTTDELITRLQLLKDGNQFPFTSETISNIETVLKRADLVKFAKSAPDLSLAEMDKHTIAKEIDNVKSCLPEPTEAEKLLDQEYKDAQERKAKRKKILITTLVSLGLILAIYTGFGLKYGFGYVNDTLLGDDTKALLEGDWVESAYGFPPIWIETPEVLRRLDSTESVMLNDKMSSAIFAYGSIYEHLYIRTGTTKVLEAQGETVDEQKAINLNSVVEDNLSKWEALGVKNILTKEDQIETPNGAQGLRIHGTAQFPGKRPDSYEEAAYEILSFTTENVIQQVVLVWRTDNNYADALIERIKASIELIPDELAQQENEN